MANYDIGDKITLQVTFTNDAGAATDPTNVTLKIRPPSGTVVTKAGTVAAPGEMTNPSVGVWKFNYDITEAGTHSWRYEGTGAIKVAEEGTFVVDPTAF